MKTPQKRKLGRSEISVSPIGMGCWAIGGPMIFQGMNLGWGIVDDAESKKALNKAYELGINFFDTADVYGLGHSEKIIGEVFANKRDKIVLATKFGWVFNEKEMTGMEGNPSFVRKALEASLKRLNTDYIDLYQFHLADYPLDDALKTRDVLEDLVSEGKIKAYGWSTDKYENAQLFAEGPNCSAIQQEINLFIGNMDLLKLCEEQNLASLNRGPLAMGILTGKFNTQSQLPEDDCRAIVDKMGDPYYMFFQDGKPLPDLLHKLESVKEILKSNGRTLAQGALSWILAKSDKTIPIPGFKTVKQVEDNAGAINFGPLGAAQLNEIELLLSPARNNA